MYRKNLWHTECKVWYLYQGFDRTMKGIAAFAAFREDARRLEGDYTIHLNLIVFGKFGRIPRGSKAIGFTDPDAAMAFKLIHGDRILKTVVQK